MAHALGRDIIPRVRAAIIAVGSELLGTERLDTNSLGLTEELARYGVPLVRKAVVGDSIFAGSMGGGMVSYADALKNNKEQILTLPDETVIAPGHGPLTTVGEEKRNNPFFTA